MPSQNVWYWPWPDTETDSVDKTVAAIANITHFKGEYLNAIKSHKYHFNDEVLTGDIEVDGAACGSIAG